MRVGFNAQLLSYRAWYRSAGISRYLDRLLTHLAPHLADAGCVAFVGPDVPADVSALSWLQVARTAVPTWRPLVRILWEQLALPVALRRWQVDLLHAPAYVAPLVGVSRRVVTFHDLSFYLLPAAFHRSNRLYLQTFARLTARRADRLIAVSEATRGDLIRLLGVTADRIDVVPNGVDAEFRPARDEALLTRFRQARGLPERFLLYLGTLEPRKNVPTLLRAYALARRRGVTEPLVLAGGRGWGEAHLTAQLAALGLREWVRQVGFVPRDEQALWYNAATLFVYPSLYEGFGLPALEAMACGTPVIAANRSALPEVVGDAGVLVDPSDEAALADALLTVLRDADLRADLARRGLARSRRFTWDATAKATVRSYARALGAP